MKILVTGCMGFIGSHFVKHTLAKYPDIYVIGTDRNTDQRSNTRLNNLGFYPNFKLFFTDLTHDISELLEGVDIVFNFGAKSFVDHSQYSPKSFIDSNILGVFNMLENIRYRKKRPTLVQISTDEVYGQTEGSLPFSEEAKLKPSNPYSATKCCGDLLCEAYMKSYGMEILITRCENNYGEYQHPQKVLPVYIRHALEDKKLPVYAPGTHLRKWLYVDDHCDAIWTLYNQGQRGVHNVAGGEERQNIDLAKRILFLCARDEGMIEMIDASVIRPSHDKRYHIQATYLDDMGWKPKVGFEEGTQRTVDWYKENRQWLIP